MTLSKKLMLVLMVGVVLAAGAFSVMAQDGRINVVHHFGGDVLYCNLEDGCSMVNMQGELLWEVSEADIDAAMATACETREAQIIEPGNGTYGPATLEIACYEGYEPSLTLSSWDEWGKPNAMQFGADYAPVYPAPSEESSTGQPSEPASLCRTAVAPGGSYGGGNKSSGYDVWDDGGDGIIMDKTWEFLYFTDEKPDLPTCVVEK